MPSIDTLCSHSRSASKQSVLVYNKKLTSNLPIINILSLNVTAV